MERILGEKSYNPKNFMIDFWGTKAGEDTEYVAFRERKLKGNILLAAYYSPVTIQELSMELGCAVPYLEDECRLLIRRQYLIEKSGKYLSNIPIFTQECTKDIGEKTAAAVNDAKKRFIRHETDAFTSAFECSDENLTRWLILTLCCHFAMLRTSDMVDKTYGELPSDGPYSLVNGGGGNGLVWGKTDQPMNKIKGIYNGCPSNDGRGSVVAFNFQQVRNAQHFTTWWNDTYLTDPLVCTALGYIGYLDKEYQEKLRNAGYAVGDKANFAVFTQEEYERVQEILSEQICCLTDLFEKSMRIAATVCADHAPSHIRRAAEHTGAMVYTFKVLELFADSLWEEKWLAPVSDTDKPCMFVIRMDA